MTSVSLVVAMQNGAHSKRLGRVANPGTFVVFLFKSMCNMAGGGEGCHYCGLLFDH